MTVHMVAAARFPEMAMGEEEAFRLAVAICDYLKHSSIAVSAKNRDLMALLFALVMIEGTRVMAIGARLKQEAAQRKAQRHGAVPNVVPMAGEHWPG